MLLATPAKTRGWRVLVIEGEAAKLVSHCKVRSFTHLLATGTKPLDERERLAHSCCTRSLALCRAKQPP